MFTREATGAHQWQKQVQQGNPVKTFGHTVSVKTFGRNLLKLIGTQTLNNFYKP